MSLIYLASPYSHPDLTVIERRFHAACRAAAHLMREGNCVFSPVAHSHPISDHIPEARLSHEFWLKQDFEILRHADMLMVLKLDGWEQSYGVGKEIEFALTIGIPVAYQEEV